MNLRLTAIVVMNLVTLTALLKLWRSYARTRGHVGMQSASSSAMLVAQTGNQVATLTPSAQTETTTASSKSIVSTMPELAATSVNSSTQQPTSPSPMNSGASEAGNRGRAARDWYKFDLPRRPLPPSDPEALF